MEKHLSDGRRPWTQARLPLSCDMRGSKENEVRLLVAEEKLWERTELSAGDLY